MEIKITKKQNVKVDGVKYVAKAYEGCAGCAFQPIEMDSACREAPCSSGRLLDGLSVIFVKKESKWIPVNGEEPRDLDPGTSILWKTKSGSKGGPCSAGALAWQIGYPNEVTHYRLAKEPQDW